MSYIEEKQTLIKKYTQYCKDAPEELLDGVLENMLNEHAHSLLLKCKEAVGYKPVMPELKEYLEMVNNAVKNGRYDDMFDNGWNSCRSTTLQNLEHLTNLEK